MSTYDMLRAHYATRSDAELRAIAGTPDLPPEARRALDDELASRNMDPEVRRQAAIAALMAGMEQEKQESLARTRRTFGIAIGVGLICAATLALYAVRQAFPGKAARFGLLGFAVVAIVGVGGAVVARRRKRAEPEQQQSDEPPSS